jgi:hypothetical protein
MSKTRPEGLYRGEPRIWFLLPGKSLPPHRRQTGSDGGASRDRTDDLKLAKLALSQLSYGPEPLGVGVCRLCRLH